MELRNKIGGQVIPSTFIVSKDEICEKLIAYNQESIIRELTYYGLLILPTHVLTAITHHSNSAIRQ